MGDTDSRRRNPAHRRELPRRAPAAHRPPRLRHRRPRRLNDALNRYPHASDIRQVLVRNPDRYPDMDRLTTDAGRWPTTVSILGDLHEIARIRQRESETARSNLSQQPIASTA